MIPEFPQFAPVPLSGASAIADLAGGARFNSDFAHSNLWAWAIARRVRVSKLNGSLVVRYENGLTKTFAYTFCGGRDPGRTARVLLDVGDTQGLPSMLRLIPEASARAIGGGFRITEDRDYFEYLYDTASIVGLHGRHYHAQRRHLNHFQKLPDAQVELLDLCRGETIREIAALSQRWLAGKNEHAFAESVWGVDDLSPMLRLLDCAAHFPLLAMGVRLGGDLIACIVAEICGGYAIAHFGKADTARFGGAGVVAMTELAKELLARGCTVLNYQEDMGVPSLRTHKLRWRPIGFVKKYIVEPVAQNAVRTLGAAADAVFAGSK